MERQSIEALIQELDRLQIAQVLVINEIRQRNVLEGYVQAVREPPAAREPARTESPAVSDFRIGDKVRITNSVSNLLGRRTGKKDGEGVVFKLTKKRVHIRTVTGMSPLRSPCLGLIN